MIGGRHLCIFSRRSEAARYCIELVRTQRVVWKRLVAILYLVGIKLGHDICRLSSAPVVE